MTAVALDLTDPAAPAELVNRALDDHGHIDVLVNNVGATRIRLDGFLAIPDEEFEWALQMNFFTTLRACRAALAAMLTRGSGAIVNVASVNAFDQPDGATVDYGAAKAAVANLTKSLAQEFGPKGIRVNAVSPGPVSTDLWLGEHGVAQTVAAKTGVDADTARQQIVAGMGGLATGRFEYSGGSSDARCAPRFRAHLERDRSQLRHRRRIDQDHVSPTRIHMCQASAVPGGPALVRSTLPLPLHWTIRRTSSAIRLTPTARPRARIRPSHGRLANAVPPTRPTAKA